MKIQIIYPPPLISIFHLALKDCRKIADTA